MNTKRTCQKAGSFIFVQTKAVCKMYKIVANLM